MLQIRCKVSDIAMKYKSKLSLVQDLGDFVRNEEWEIIAKLLRARYFDYTPYFEAVCGSLNDTEVIVELMTVLGSEFTQFTADCYALAVKRNGYFLSDIDVNPLQSRHFKAGLLPKDLYLMFLKRTILSENKNICIIWDQALKGIPESQMKDYLSVVEWNDPPARLWSTISFSALEAGCSGGVRQQIFEIFSYSGNNSSRGELIARLLLIGYIYRRTSVMGVNEFFDLVREESRDLLIQNLVSCLRFGGKVSPCNESAFIGVVFNELKASFPATATPFLNFLVNLSWWSERESDWLRIVEAVGRFLYDPKKDWPTIQQSCTILSLKGTASSLTNFISLRPEYLHSLFHECPKRIPNSPALLPFQTRAESFFKSNRFLPSGIGEFSLSSQVSDSLSRLLMICNQLEALYSLHRRELIQMRVSVSPSSVSTDKVYRFTLVIRSFFHLFLQQRDWYVFKDEQRLLIPSVQCPPQILFSFGFLIGAAIIFQHKLPFHLSFEYFQLLRSKSLTESFYQENFGLKGAIESIIYPFTSAPLFVMTSVLRLQPPLQATSIGPAEQEQIFSAGLEQFRLGFESICNWNLFSSTEFYNLIPHV